MDWLRYWALLSRVENHSSHQNLAHALICHCLLLKSFSTTLWRNSIKLLGKETKFHRIHIKHPVFLCRFWWDTHSHIQKQVKLRICWLHLCTLGAFVSAVISSYTGAIFYCYFIDHFQLPSCPCSIYIYPHPKVGTHERSGTAELMKITENIRQKDC